MKDCSSNQCSETSNYSPTLYVNNTVFVDGRFGDDETAIPEIANKATKTIKAAFKLIKKTRKSEKQLWNMVIRPGKYILKSNQVFLPNVFVSGSGLGTKVYGEIKIIGNNELAGFQLFSNQFPAIQVSIKQKFINATVIFTQLSIHIIAESALPVDSELIGIIMSSRSINSSVVVKNCIVNFDLNIPQQIDFKAFVFPSSNIRIAFLTNTIQVFSHGSNGITVIENIGALTDFELGQIVINTSTNNIKKNIVYYSNASDQLMFIKDNRIVYTSTIVNQNPTPTIGPPYVIYYLAKNNGAIQSVNAVTNVLNIPIARRMIAFTESLDAKVTSQGLISIGLDVGNIGGVGATIPNSQTGLSVSDPINTIQLSTSASGIFQATGGVNGGLQPVNEENFVSGVYNVTRFQFTYTVVVSGLLNHIVIIDSPRILGFVKQNPGVKYTIINLSSGVNIKVITKNNDGITQEYILPFNFTFEFRLIGQEPALGWHLMHYLPDNINV